jgi:hypothetical protein
MIHSETKNAYHQKKLKTAAAKQHKTELSDMGLFELSIHALMPEDVFKELKRRIELIQKHFTALEVVNSLLKNPQETRR